MTEKLTGILIVDDEGSVRRLLRNRLTDEGYQCHEAPNARQALYALRRKNIDLVMLDIKMPGKSGVELLPEIISGYPDISVIMITATADMQTAIQCLKQGAYDYITKPFALDEIIISATRALEKRRLELENKEYQQHLEEKVAEQANKIRASFLNAITALVYALEAKDAYTSGHSQRVSDLSAAIARKLNLPRGQIDKLKLAGLLHDIGKIGVQESVLNKPGRLTEAEFALVKRHPEIGEHILSPIVDSTEILEAVRNHHEHFNGKGYPDGLQKDKIPLSARILAISDAYEAMTSERPYRKSMSADAARHEIERNQGTQFDPEITATFTRIKEPHIPTPKTKARKSPPKS
ncbi:MAG: response regulator [Dehalococcoidales bacterium]|nr:response regulator [Dehalococcoidales bacterium]